MQNQRIVEFVGSVVENMPADWLNLTTHRLDIYNESLAKTEFIEQFNVLFENNRTDTESLEALRTAYDYIRLGHPLSCVLEWSLAKSLALHPEQIFSFSSKLAPFLAVLRANLFLEKKTLLLHADELPSEWNLKVLRDVYGYQFETKKISEDVPAPVFEGSIVRVSNSNDLTSIQNDTSVDFTIQNCGSLGAILLVSRGENRSYIKEIQHVRRRETIAMTPANSLKALHSFLGKPSSWEQAADYNKNLQAVRESIIEITNSQTKPLVASSGLSIQYAIVMGLIHHAKEKYPSKQIHIMVPPNCYGGTNDQARRIAASLPFVSVVDLPVDGGNDMVKGVDWVLEQAAKEDAVPFIIAEIPTNPRVEVPDLDQLQLTLSKERTASNGNKAVEPVFILDQTFCPNVHFLGEGDFLSKVQTIAYFSGSKFPSGGKCTAGFCTSNKLAEHLMEKIEFHLYLCDNQATDLQLEILAKQMPSMNDRIKAAYLKTREFVNFIGSTLPEAKINFVSEELALLGFTPSVFSLDLPTKGESVEERENYKRLLNLKLIDMMITEIPDESKYCVSYGQMKGCYWTIPATSTQGTTKEDDKDYIARVALSGNIDLERHKEVFRRFVELI